MSGLVKDSSMFLDLGRVEDLCAKCETARDIYKKLLGPCRVARPVPCPPAYFRQKLGALHFSEAADRGFVMRAYLSTFQQVMGSIKEMYFGRLHWGPEEAEALAASLPWCRSLEALDLTGCTVGPEAAERLAGALGACPSLQTLDLQACGVGDAGLEHLLQSLPGTDLRRLFLAANGVTDAGAGLLAEHLGGSGARLLEVSLRDNKVSGAGALRLAGALRRPSCPLEVLRLAQNPLGDAGAEGLMAAAAESPRLRVLDLRRAAVGAAGRAGLEAARGRNAGLEVEL